MKSKLFLRVFIAYVVITSLFAALISIATYQVITYRYRNDVSTALRNLCVVTARLVEPAMTDTGIDIRNSIDANSIDPKTRIIVLDVEGSIKLDTNNDPDSLKYITTSKPFINALDGTTGTYSNAGVIGHYKDITVTTPIKRNDRVIGVVITSLPIDTAFMTITPLVFVAFSLIILFFAVIGAFIFSINLSQPIEELAHAAKRVGEGDFGARVFLNRDDELKELADRFNFMTERIAFLFHEVRRQKEEVLAIISSLEEGLLVVGKDDRIVLFNDSFGSISHDIPVAGRYYWEALRDLRIAEHITSIKRDGRRRADEIEINGKAYAVVITPIPSEDEIVVVFHDISDITNLQRLKKEFVSNVSHELRTPLTAVKGFLESLDVVEEGKRGYYIDIIRRNTNRMISIIKDLLILSEFEERDVGIQPQAVDVEEMVRGIITMFENAAAEKGLSLALDIPKRPIIAWVDPFRLEQMFINLIDNAVKYTVKGSITITLSLTDTEFIAEIEDTGIGIPKQEVSRIFDRFYRVDKSRSRILGGTGLGLSIVKHIVLIHNGSIQVKSREGEGTRFIVRLPQNHSSEISQA